MEELYKKKGQAMGVMNQIVAMVIGIVVIVLLVIFGGTLGGQTYQLVESDIDAINDTTIKGHIEASITSGFESLEQTTDYLPIIVLAVIISIVLALVLGFSNMGGYGRGGAL